MAHPLCWLAFLLACEARPLGPFSTAPPPFPKAKHPLVPSDLFGGGLSAPYPTNAWWQDTVLEDGTGPITPEPYQLQFHPNGLVAALSPKVVSPDSLYMHTGFQYGLRMAFGAHVRREVSHHDALSLTIQYNDSKTGAPVAAVPVVRGAPYVTAILQRPTPIVIETVHCAITGLQSDHKRRKHDESNVVTGTTFTVHLNTTQSWLLFTETEVTLHWTPTGLVSAAPAPHGAVLRLAALPSASPAAASALLGKFAHCVATGGAVDVDVGDGAVTTRMTWHAAAPGKKPCRPLIVAMPHLQALLSRETHTFTALQYEGLLGPLVGVVASEWAYRLPLFDVSWSAPRPIAPEWRDKLRSQVLADAHSVGFAPEPYAFGKQVCRFARLSLIAEELGLAEAVNKSDDIIRSSFETWMGDRGADDIVFDATWYGVVPKSGLGSPDADFGAGYYNDHHFHYGYWLYAAAVVSRHDPAWGRRFAPHFTALARDIANPSRADPFFPAYRHFDWYAGHSWASGLMAFTAGRNQESTSEAINAWYAMQLYGEAIGDASLADTGRALLAHEVEAAQTYWRSTNARSVYPKAIARHKGIGMVWENKVDVSTWFGAGPVYALAINILPFTPVTEVYLRKDWVREALPVLTEALGSGTYDDDWKVIIYLTQAQIDPKAAWANLHRVTVRSDEGMTLSNVMWWVATRADPGAPDPPLPQPVEVPPTAPQPPSDTNDPPSTQPPSQDAVAFRPDTAALPDPAAVKASVLRHTTLWVGTATVAGCLAMLWFRTRGPPLYRQEHNALLSNMEEASYHT